MSSSASAGPEVRLDELYAAVDALVCQHVTHWSPLLEFGVLDRLRLSQR